MPVAVITNGSLLYRPALRRELAAADAVLPSLDAGSSMLYSRINRPHHGLAFEQHVRGLTQFRREYHGRLWLEVMLVRGMNDSTAALGDIADVLRHVEPDEVHISVPTRPPSESWVQPPAAGALDRATAILGDVARVLLPTQWDSQPTADDDAIDSALAIISRHPLRETELMQLLERQAPGRVLELLSVLAHETVARVVERYGERFWCAADARFAENDRTASPAAVSSSN
jgi:wyosine [tRNA(Phe)-imidazoG37] synthetase (radical SAM superfamily)